MSKLIENTTMTCRESKAVATLMRVYAEEFAGEDFYVGVNPKTGNIYLALEDSSVVPFIDLCGDLMFEVFDFETGDVEEFNNLKEAREYAEDICVQLIINSYIYIMIRVKREDIDMDRFEEVRLDNLPTHQKSNPKYLPSHFLMEKEENSRFEKVTYLRKKIKK